MPFPEKAPRYGSDYDNHLENHGEDLFTGQKYTKKHLMISTTYTYKTNHT